MSSVPMIPLTLNTSENDITKEFYEPCLAWAKYYDRGVGYFTSGWLRENSKGMSVFASRGGKARWITSPLLGAADLKFFKELDGTLPDDSLVEILRKNVRKLQESLERDTLNALAWMVFDGVIEFRFAMPTAALEGGDFHDKFGIFRDDGEGNRLSFNGSQNDSIKGNRNYEGIKAFPSWQGLSTFVDDDQRRFDRIWAGFDLNVKVYRLPEAISAAILELRNEERPYKAPNSLTIIDQWRHQDEAVQAFLEAEHGVLEMATGTGKTRTALKIAEVLLQRGAIQWVMVTTRGTDLLDQWQREILLRTDLSPFRYYDSHNDLGEFRVGPKDGALLVSRRAENLLDVLRFTSEELRSKALVIFDEVHGMGSESLAQTLPGQLSTFRFRLGLSATPEREYDEVGNEFIKNEIGDVIYRFGLEDAISRGILCEFDYVPLRYELTDEDRTRMHQLIAAHNAKKSRGQMVSDTDLYRDLAMVRKVSMGKVPVLRDYLIRNADVLKRSIIFVGSREFGRSVQDEVIKHRPDYHTYFAADDRVNLLRFAKGELNCLITSHRISEGIDIRTVDNVILCSADRAKLETIQRIGRCLRIDPDNAQKRARVVDFVEDSSDDKQLADGSDHARAVWLAALAEVKKEV